MAAARTSCIRVPYRTLILLLIAVFIIFCLISFSRNNITLNFTAVDFRGEDGTVSPEEDVKLADAPSSNPERTTRLMENYGTEKSDICHSPGSIVKHFIMTKIEKTGSSTLHSILARYVLNNRLNLLNQANGFHIDWTKLTKDNGWLIGPKEIEKADVMICHARYNESIFEEYFAPDYKYIVPVRHPISWLQSAVFYFSNELHHIKENSTEKVIMDDSLMYHGRGDPTNIKSYFHLPQLQWLGLDYKKYKSNITAIKHYVEWITQKIDLVILHDQYDASLILLRRRFCWSYTDVFYSSKEVQVREDEILTAAAQYKLLSAEVNLGELLLYERLNQTWWTQHEVNQADFWLEVKYFSALNLRLSVICKEEVKLQIPILIPESQWHERFNVTEKLCTYILLGKQQFRMRMIDYTKGSFIS